MANQHTKTILHMAALSYIKAEGELQDFFKRKVDQQKNKISVIKAIRNKIVLRVFDCIKNNRAYQKTVNITWLNHTPP